MDNNTKKVLLEDHYRPPRHIQEEIFEVYDKYIKWRSLREQSYKQFNGKSLSEWLQESREKFWGYMPLNADLDTPQFFFPETRNQIIAILSKMANLRMKPHFEGVEGFDIVKATILKDLFEYWRRSSNKKIRNFWQFLYTIINGTAVVFVGYRHRKRKVKNIKLHNPDTGETEFEEVDQVDSDIYDEICNLEDIYIPKIWEPDIQAQGKLIWRTLLTWAQFKSLFDSYEAAEYVMPGMQFADQSIFSQFLSYDVRGGDFVEVLKYFDVDADKYMIIANGVLLNPIKEKGGRQSICPLPWNHKKLPFAKTIFEPLDASFFYGLSLPQKVKSPQEALNRMWELLLERETRAVSAPIITDDPSLDLGLEFKPGRIYQVGTDPTRYREMQVSSASPSYWNTLNSLQGIINKTGSGGLTSIIPSRQPRSATEKAIEEQSRRETAGLYYMFYEDLIEQVAWLAIQNMIQFYTAEQTERILGKRKFHKILSLINVQLAGGGVGNREIRIVDQPASAEKLREETWVRSMFKKEKVEIIEVSPKALQQLKFDIKIDFEPDLSPVDEKALFLDYLVTIQKLFGQTGLMDNKKLLFRTVEKFGESISDVLPDTLIQDYEMERFGVQPNTKPVEFNVESLPMVNAINQRVRGQRFGVQGPAARIQQEVGESPLQSLTQ